MPARLSLPADQPRFQRVIPLARRLGWPTLFGWLLCFVLTPLGPRAFAQQVAPPELTEQAVRESIQRGVSFLTTRQARNGSWNAEEAGERHEAGITALCTLALANCGVSTNDPVMQRALKYLRSLPPGQPDQTYDLALVIMALAAVHQKDPADVTRLAALSTQLAGSQVVAGERGGWTYNARGTPGGGGDPSNSQFAILGLREASECGIPIDRAVWQEARDYWERIQSADGGWSYERKDSSGSMTAAGISSMTIIDQMLRSDDGVLPDGTPPCCVPTPVNDSLERGIRWMRSNFTASRNPGTSGIWLLYYLYGIERTGRLTGLRFLGEHDWYREGAETLLMLQVRNGSWKGVGVGESDPVVGTSLALLFLSKGLAPVVISKLKYGDRDPLRPQEVADNDWNRHPRDVRSLADFISGRPQWPTLLTAQEVDIGLAATGDGLPGLLQSRVIYLTGQERPRFTAAEKKLLQQYLEQGGFLFASPTCQSVEFEAGLRELLVEILPPGEGQLKLLSADHPIYRSEFLLEPAGVPLYGIDFGCRTSVIYSPEDLGCLWEYWSRSPPAQRIPQLTARVLRASSIGVNVLAYATGRQPPTKLQLPDLPLDEQVAEEIERGLLQVAKIRHAGQWDAAPRALRNLLTALNQTVGLAASTKPRDLSLSDATLFDFPLIYMHGRDAFTVSQKEKDQLRAYLERGGVLFADACCGAKPFDRSFRDLIAEIFPEHPLAQIPIEHELFSEEIGHDVRKLRRRMLSPAGGNGALGAQVQQLDTFLEGVEVDGRYMVIYSRFDLSCALERQASLSCEGYLPEDAVKLATNIVLYSMLQPVRLPEPSSK